MQAIDTDPKRVWAWAFGGSNDPEMKTAILNRYADALERIDPRAAIYLTILIDRIPAPRIYKPGTQAQLFTDYGKNIY